MIFIGGGAAAGAAARVTAGIEARAQQQTAARNAGATFFFR
jgi:hypothetical protein